MENKRLAPKNRRSGKGLLGVVIGVGLLAVGGFAAYKYLFNRPGEAAAGFIPADASMVLTLDLSPSDRQLDTFNAITQAINDEGIAEKLDGFLKSAFDKDPMGAEIRQHLKRNFAIAVWQKGEGKMVTMALLAVDDPGAVNHALESKAKPNGDGIFSLSVPPQTVATVLDGYLVIGDSTEAIQRIQAVHAGKEKSVTGLPAFSEARAALPKDANLMVFMSPNFITNMTQMFSPKGAKPFDGIEWMAYSATLEPDGIAFDYQCPFDAKAIPGLAALGNTTPFALDSLKALPDGAYGVVGVSQFGKYYGMFEDSLHSQTADLRAQIDKGIADFEKESGLSIAKDIVPALEGEQILAVYPGPTGEGLDMDVALVATNGNGATPAALAGKVRDMIERESAKHNDAVKFIESKVGDVTVWEIDPKAREEMINGLYGGMTHAQSHPVPMEMPGGPDTHMPGAPDPKMRSMMDSPPAEIGPKPAAKYKDKSMICAVFSDKVVVTSSHKLLNAMIDSAHGGKTLADSPAFQNMKERVIDGSQSVIMVDVRRIMETLRPTIESGMKDAPIKADDVLNLFGDGKIGMVGSGVYDGKVTRGRMFMPLDWQRLIHMIGAGMRQMGGPGPDMGAMPEMRAPITK